MLSAAISKLSANTPIAIMHPNFRTSRGLNAENVNLKTVVDATLLSNVRHEARSNWNGHAITYDSLAALNPVLSQKGSRDYGFLASFIDEFGATKWFVAEPNRIIATASDWNAIKLQREMAEALHKAQMLAAQEERANLQARKNEAWDRVKDTVTSRQSHLRESLPATLNALVGEKRAQGSDFYFNYDGDYVEANGGLEYVISSWGSVRIPITALQRLFELALIGKENS